MTMEVANVHQDGNDGLMGYLDRPVGNRKFGQKVHLSGAEVAIPVRDEIRLVVGRTEQVSVGTGVTRIAGANPYRKSIKITNLTGTQLIYLGFTNAVSSTTGDYLHSAAGSNTTIMVYSEIWGIAAVSAQTVTVMEEEYDH